LISVHDDFEHNGEKVRLIKLRNPWGTGEWEGAWSDKSELWTQELRDSVAHQDSDDGKFCMTLEDYVNNFAWSSFCVTNDDTKYQHSNLIYDFSDKDFDDIKPAFFSFEVKEEIDFAEFSCAITLQQ